MNNTEAKLDAQVTSNPGATLKTPLIPDHQLLRRIGRGAYGEVWLARSATGAYRAVKIVYRQSFDHERPFEREFSGILKFEPISREHESQVDILHVGRGENCFYYVMELADDQVRGQQIEPSCYAPKTIQSELVRRGKLPVEECVQTGIALTTALEHLHDHGLVHRDVKPSNLIFVNGVPKLADIGLVTGVDATRSFVGTEGFAPPEGPGTPQGDLYSLGKVLYEMATGKDRQDFPELPTNVAELPDHERLVELNAVIAKACRQDARMRYRSASEMRDDLLLLEAGKSVCHRRFVERRLIQARRVFVIIAAASLLLGGAYMYRDIGIALHKVVGIRVLTGPIINPANGHQYYLLDQSDWSQAEKKAQAMGGHLATVRNQAEQDFIFHTFSMYAGTARHLMIGLYDTDRLHNAGDSESRKKEFAWVSGEAVTYSNWAPGEPNNYNEGGEFWVNIFSPTWKPGGRWSNVDATDGYKGCPMNGVVEIVPKPR